jgi:hypothetical protein
MLKVAKYAVQSRQPVGESHDDVASGLPFDKTAWNRRRWYNYKSLAC